jgi:hypothetical protein
MLFNVSRSSAFRCPRLLGGSNKKSLMLLESEPGMGHPASSWSPTFQNVTSQENFQAERPPAHRAGEAELSSGMPRRLLPLVKVLFTKPPYVAGPHPWADKFVPRHLSDAFGQFPFVYGDPLANQFDGSFLIGFVCEKIPHDSRVSLGIESRDPDVPSCWHSHAPQLSSVNDLPYTN